MSQAAKAHGLKRIKTNALEVVSPNQGVAAHDFEPQARIRLKSLENHTSQCKAIKFIENL
jgi:hypothetical protein